ncbi:MAG: MFS transporter [Verrucomicrobia bacterium]|nr:MFS transporter [Verrucomicrobiota bacterium]
MNPLEQMPEKPKHFRAGSLVYTRMGLFAVCAWLLWGDFAFNLMEIVAGSFIPLKLKHLDAPNWMLGLFVTTVPSLLGITFAPVISVASDRTRSRWGRRIPYLAAATPFVCLFLLLLGFSEDLGAWLQNVLFVNATPTVVALWLAGALVVAFQFFNVFITSLYFCLFNDVVPQEFLSRFLALFRMIGIVATAGFQYFLFGMAESHMKEIFAGSALLYGLAFFLMCVFVKEGTYDPPPSTTGPRHGLLHQIQTYARECFTNRLYWYFFLANTFWGLGFAVVSFRVFFAQSVGLNLDQFGKLMGGVGIASAVLLYPAAALADRWHPLRVMILGIGLLVLVVPLQLVFVFMDIPAPLATRIYTGLFILHITVQVLFNAAQLPMFMRVLPKDRFGQFNSANGIIASASMIVAGVVSGAWLDWLDLRISEPLYHYRYLPIWVSTCLVLCLVFLILLYKEWKKHGGDKNYEPPK